MNRKIWHSIFAVIALTLCFSGLSYAQEVTGSIVGTVKDSSGAVVPGATVTVIDPAKNDLVVRTVTATDDGTFSVPNVPVSSYTVTVEAPNFKKSVNTKVKVDVGQRRSIDVALEAGKIDETVTVTADQVAVELTTPTASTTINGDQVRELSVNNRNFVQLVTLAPGVSSNLSDQVYVGNFNPEAGQANTVSISVNGARSSQNTFTVDGADITDRGSNLTIQTYPSVDSIGEFKVLRSLYPAESGRSGGGQVNIVTRSGTDSFHGSLFEFVRNDRFNANSFFNNRNHPLGVDSNGKARRLPFRYNNYGFTIGGPIYFLRMGEVEPDASRFAKVKRTYFFFSEEQRKDRRFPTLSSLVPTAGMRTGVFSFPICLSGTIAQTTGARTCNQILPAGTPLSSVATINPVSQAYLSGIFNKIPLPNNGTYSLVFPASGREDFQQEILKIDTSITKNWSSFYRYERDEIPTIEINSIFGNGSGIPGVSTGATNSPGRTHTFSSTYVASPNLIFDGRYSYSYGAITLSNIGLMAKNNTPISVPLPYAAGSEINPWVSVSGLNGLTSMGAYDNFSNKKDLSGNITWILGNHTTKFGATFSKYRKHENALGGTPQGAFSGFLNSTSASPVQGTICISPTDGTTATTCSGNQNGEQSFANFLLGNNVSFTQTKLDLTADFRQKNFEWYAQDEFRATRRLTLYYGLRYSFFGSPWDSAGLLSNFDPAAYSLAAAPTVRGNGTRVSGSGNFCDGIIVNAQNFQTGPPSYNCTPTISPYGKFVVKAPKNNFAPRVGLAWDPFGKGQTVIRTGYGIYHEQTLVGTFENHLGSNPPYQETITVSQTRIDQPVAVGASPAVVASENPPNLIRGVQTDYKTPYMQHWSLDLQHQLDKNTIIEVGYYGSKGTHLIGVVDINNLRPGYALTQDCAVGTSTTKTVKCQSKDADDVPVSFLNGTQELILDQIRPYQGWRGIFMIQPRFNSNYHSLQVSATRRFSGASQVQLAYTWSKNLSDNQTDRSTAPMDTYNIAAERGRAQLDRRHILTVNYIYELPWFRNEKGFAGALLGGWQTSGIVTYQTGLPFTPTYSGFDPAGIGFLNSSSPAGGRPFIFGDPNKNAPHSATEWFDVSQFQSPPTPTTAPAVPGDAPRGIIEGPPTFRVDFSLMKNFRFTESMRLQLRGEAFNLFNRTNYSGIGTTASTVSTFGTVTSTRDPRVLQFGIKFYF